MARAGARRAAGDATLAVHLQPKAARTEVVGWHGAAIKIRVAAPPVDGAANTELLRFLAARLGVSRSRVALAGGAASRSKRVVVRGMREDDALRRLGLA